MSDRFLVAFSLAGEQRDLVRAVAEEVERQLGPGTVFYDEWYEAVLAGDDADLVLQRIYNSGCELAVVCVSGNYDIKPWTKIEHRAIRARYQAEADRYRILPVRVGDGNVEGILLNAIVPDIRARSTASAAQLIIDRLDMFRPDPRPVGQSTEIGWPADPPSLDWRIADHADARAAFATLLTSSSPHRVMSICGPSETGKSHISKQMLANGTRLDGLDCGRFDFKGTTNMDVEFDALSHAFDIDPPAGSGLNQRFRGIFTELKKRARPTLLILDTYEAAGEAADWVERGLLPGLLKSDWLRVVVIGQTVPVGTNEVWHSVCCDPINLRSPEPADWHEYGMIHRPDDNVTLHFVTQVHQMSQGKASLLASLLGPK